MDEKMRWLRGKGEGQERRCRLRRSSFQGGKIKPPCLRTDGKGKM